MKFEQKILTCRHDLHKPGRCTRYFFSRELFFRSVNFSNVRSFIAISNLRKIWNLRKMGILNLRKTLAKPTFPKPKGFFPVGIFSLLRYAGFFSCREKQIACLRTAGFVNIWELCFLKCGDVPEIHRPPPPNEFEEKCRS